MKKKVFIFIAAAFFWTGMGLAQERADLREQPAGYRSGFIQKGWGFSQNWLMKVWVNSSAGQPSFVLLPQQDEQRWQLPCGVENISVQAELWLQDGQLKSFVAKTREPVEARTNILGLGDCQGNWKLVLRLSDFGLAPH